MMAVVLIMAVFVVLLNSSFGYFKKRIEGTKLTFNVGTLNYELECVDLENCEVIIPANESEVVNLNLTSLNKIDTKYELYYEVVSPTDTENIIDGGHLLTDDLTDIGEISKNETKNISLIIYNTGSDKVTLKLGIAPSLKNNEPELEENQVSLNGIAYQKYYVYDYTGDYETFVAPTTGTYKLEAWGAQGGTTSTSATGGKGAYTSGIIKLQEKEEIYVYVGGKGSATSVGVAQVVSGGYNGGGSTAGQSGWSRSFGTGGGATDFRLKDGAYDDETSLASRIMVAAGGGGAFQGQNVAFFYSPGGYGGALIGGEGAQGSGSDDQYCYGEGGTQTSGGIITTNCTYSSNYKGGTVTGGFGYGGGSKNSAITGAGSGYYGGSRSGHIASGGGGSSYVSGYLGCVAISSEENVTPKSGCTNGTNDISCSYHYSDKIFTNSIIKAGNQTIPSHNASSTQTGNSGNGYAKITYLGSNTYTVKYNANSGNGTMEDYQAYVGETFTLEKNTFTKEGYIFAGWSTTPDVNEVMYDDLEVVSNIAEKNETVTLYAKWSTGTYVINFYSNENYIYDANLLLNTLSGRKYYKRNNGGALAAYVYNGNYTGPVLVSSVSDNAIYYTTYDVNANSSLANFEYKGKTYYYSNGGMWMPNNLTDNSGGLKKYVITDVGNASATSKAVAMDLLENNTLSNKITYYVDVSKKIPDITHSRTGYTFLGWSDTPTGEVMYNVGQYIKNITSVGEIKELYAIWKKS